MIYIYSMRKGSKNNKPIPLGETFKVYRVDRKSYLGNPFVMRDEKDRDRVCDAYDRYFKAELTKSGTPSEFQLKQMMADIDNGMSIVLMCWCCPKRCHAETIKKYLEDYISRKSLNWMIQGREMEVGEECESPIIKNSKILPFDLK